MLCILGPLCSCEKCAMREGRKCRELRGINIPPASKIFPWRAPFRPHCYYHVAPLSPAVLDIKTIMETVGLPADDRKAWKRFGEMCREGGGSNGRKQRITGSVQGPHQKKKTQNENFALELIFPFLFFFVNECWHLV